LCGVLQPGHVAPRPGRRTGKACCRVPQKNTMIACRAPQHKLERVNVCPTGGEIVIAGTIRGYVSVHFNSQSLSPRQHLRPRSITQCARARRRGGVSLRGESHDRQPWKWRPTPLTNSLKRTSKPPPTRRLSRAKAARRGSPTAPAPSSIRLLPSHGSAGRRGGTAKSFSPHRKRLTTGCPQKRPEDYLTKITSVT
jgi:hypothetical protein